MNADATRNEFRSFLAGLKAAGHNDLDVRAVLMEEWERLPRAGAETFCTAVLADGTTWPVPIEQMANLGWTLTHSMPDRRALLQASSVLTAYRELIALPAKRRNQRVMEIRRAAMAPQQGNLQTRLHGKGVQCP